MAGFFKREISAWMDGTESLTAEEYRVYDVVLNLIYLQEGPIVEHEAGMAGRCNMHRLKFRKALDTLVRLGKIVLADGKLSNSRAISEISKFSKPKKSPSVNSDPKAATPSQPPANPQPTHRQPGGGLADNPLKNKGPDSILDYIEDYKEEKKGSEAKASGAAAPPVYSDSRHELWGEGVAILSQLGVPEKSARSNIGRWLRSTKDDCLVVLGAIQRARDARVGDAIPWVTQAISGDANGTNWKNGGGGGRQGAPNPKRGFAAYALEQARRAAGDS